MGKYGSFYVVTLMSCISAAGEVTAGTLRSTYYAIDRGDPSYMQPMTHD